MRYWRPLLTPILLLIYWQLLSSLELISAYLLPSPITVFYSAVNMWQIGAGKDSNLLIVFYVQIMPDDLVMQLHRF